MAKWKQMKMIVGSIMVGALLMPTMSITAWANAETEVTVDNFESEILPNLAIKEDGTPLKVAITVAELDSEYVIAVQKYAQYLLETAGAEVTVSSADGDVENQCNQIYDFIEKGVDVVLIQAADSNAVAPAVKACNEAGVTAIAVGRAINGDCTVDYSALIDDVAMGKLAAEYVADNAGEGATVTTMQGTLGTASADDRTTGFAEGVEEGLIRFVGDDCKRALYDAIESRQVRPGLCKTAGLKLVYSPLNGSGLVPVTQVLKDIGITDITIVPEQEYPNGYFTTCSYPNPEIFEALELGLNLAKESDADLMLATDPDADRVGIAMKCPDGSYELVSGNEVGVLLLDYICAGRIEKGTMPEKAVAVKSLVSTPLADAVAAHYGVELRNVLTGFKWIGDQIAQLEAAGEVDRFIFGFEESYGYLAGPYVRDKDAVIASMLICEMAAYYRSIGSSLKQRLEEIYAEYGRYLNKIDSFEFPGLSGMDKMSGIMQNLRENAPAEIAGYKVTEVTDYTKTEETGLPAANVLVYKLENNETVIVRPSGTEPKIKIYYTTLGNDLAEAQAEKDKLAEALKPIMA